MKEKDLKTCWKCGKRPFFVGDNGDNSRGRDTGLVSCNAYCMDWDEIYTIEEWQSHPRPATREQLVEALRKAKKVIIQMCVNPHVVPSIVRDIEELLAGEK